MRILVVGSGGREHAAVWKLGQSSLVKEILWAPGNGGVRPPVRRVEVKADDVDGLTATAVDEKVDLVFVGPEVPLALGLSDELEKRGIACFGPSGAAARIEASKVFCKEFCVEHGIPTTPFTVFDSFDKARAHIERMAGPFPVVLKADGLAAGKGVLICGDRREALDGAGLIMEKKAFGDAGDKMILEEFLDGEEASLMVFTDGENILAMPPARDYKRAEANDLGLNTGGMGAYCPSSKMSPSTVEETLAQVVRPAVEAFRKEGSPYRGVLYAGLMLMQDGPRLLEFNCRFGDPETQVVLPLLDGDLAEIALACARGKLSDVKVQWKDEATVTVVLSSGGYPVAYEKRKTIEGLDAASSLDNTVIFHAGTEAENGKILTAGGRVLNVTGMGPSVKEARATAYKAVAKISFEKMAFRQDIAAGI